MKKKYKHLLYLIKKARNNLKIRKFRIINLRLIETLINKADLQPHCRNNDEFFVKGMKKVFNLYKLLPDYLKTNELIIRNIEHLCKNIFENYEYTYVRGIMENNNIDFIITIFYQTIENYLKKTGKKSNDLLFFVYSLLSEEEKQNKEAVLLVAKYSSYYSLTDTYQNLPNELKHDRDVLLEMFRNRRGIDLMKNIEIYKHLPKCLKNNKVILYQFVNSLAFFTSHIFGGVKECFDMLLSMFNYLEIKNDKQVVLCFFKYFNYLFNSRNCCNAKETCFNIYNNLPSKLKKDEDILMLLFDIDNIDYFVKENLYIKYIQEYIKLSEKLSIKKIIFDNIIINKLLVFSNYFCNENYEKWILIFKSLPVKIKENKDVITTLLAFFKKCSNYSCIRRPCIIFFYDCLTIELKNDVNIITSFIDGCTELEILELYNILPSPIKNDVEIINALQKKEYLIIKSLKNGWRFNFFKKYHILPNKIKNSKKIINLLFENLLNTGINFKFYNAPNGNDSRFIGYVTVYGDNETVAFVPVFMPDDPDDFDRCGRCLVKASQMEKYYYLDSAKRFLKNIDNEKVLETIKEKLKLFEPELYLKIAS